MFLPVVDLPRSYIESPIADSVSTVTSSTYLSAVDDIVITQQQKKTFVGKNVGVLQAMTIVPNAPNFQGSMVTGVKRVSYLKDYHTGKGQDCDARMLPGYPDGVRNYDGCNACFGGENDAQRTTCHDKTHLCPPGMIATGWHDNGSSGGPCKNTGEESVFCSRVCDSTCPVLNGEYGERFFLPEAGTTGRGRNDGVDDAQCRYHLEAFTDEKTTRCFVDGEQCDNPSFEGFDNEDARNEVTEYFCSLDDNAINNDWCYTQCNNATPAEKSGGKFGWCDTQTLNVCSLVPSYQSKGGKSEGYTGANVTAILLILAGISFLVYGWKAGKF